MRHLLGRTLPFLFLIVLCLALSVTTKGFATLSTLTSILRFSSVIVIIGVGMTFVIVAGGIDLSVGSVLAVSAVAAAWCIEATGPLILRLLAALSIQASPASIEWVQVVLGILVGILLGAVWGVVNGLMVVWLGLPPFVATLASMGMARGAAYILARAVSGTTTVEVRPEGFRFLANGSLFGVAPVPIVIMFVVVVLGHYVLNHMRLGRYCFAIGSNVEAARYSGIPVSRYTLAVYILLGALAGLAGMIEASFNGNGQAVFGSGYELLVIAAVVIGGGSLSGGQGTAIGTVTGALIMGVIDKGCTLQGLAYEWQLVVISVLIVIAVAFDMYQRRRTGA